MRRLIAKRVVRCFAAVKICGGAGRSMIRQGSVKVEAVIGSAAQRERATLHSPEKILKFCSTWLMSTVKKKERSPKAEKSNRES